MAVRGLLVAVHAIHHARRLLRHPLVQIVPVVVPVVVVEAVRNLAVVDVVDHQSQAVVPDVQVLVQLPAWESVKDNVPDNAQLVAIEEIAVVAAVAGVLVHVPALAFRRVPALVIKRVVTRVLVLARLTAV